MVNGEIVFTATDCDRWFCEGASKAEADEWFGTKSRNPYSEAAIAHQWWARGYAYNARLYRAIVAEKSLELINSGV